MTTGTPLNSRSCDPLRGGERDLAAGGTRSDPFIGLTDRDELLTPPSIVPNSVEAARGFSWVASCAVWQRWSADDIDASMLDVEITGADVAPGYVIDGQTYVETSGNVIDAGDGDDYVAAGIGVDVVHGGDGDDDLYGMGDNDVLFGDEGSDFIRGDRVASADSDHATTDVLHGNDILVGGAAVDNLPASMHRDNWLDDGAGNDILLSGEGRCISIRRDAPWVAEKTTRAANDELRRTA